MRTLDPLRGILGSLTRASAQHPSPPEDNRDLPDEAQMAQAVEHTNDDDRPRPPIGFHRAVWPR
jgi:hypothetical protein